MTAFAFLSALVAFAAGKLAHNPALATLGLWAVLIAFGALLPTRRYVVVVRQRNSDLDDLHALPTAAPESCPEEETL